MYAKILKESASTLSLLAVEPDETSRDMIEKNIKRFFKNITYVSSADEALWLYKSEKFDLVLVDIDTFGEETFGFIDNIHRHDSFQAITVCSARSKDPELMLTLINAQITCFIPKPSEADTMYKILSKVCSKIYDRSVLMHYLETLETQHTKALDVSCRSGCPMKAELQPIPQMKSTTPPSEEEDDFMFFPEPTAIQPSHEELSIYQDYFNFLERDDYEELHDLLSDIDASLLNAFSERVGDPLSITRLGNSLMRYGNVLIHYQFFSDMGSAILEFGKMVGDNAEMIAERSGEFQMLISGFCSGLQTYMAEVWEKNSDNPKFFNDSIVNDATTIMGMMAPVVPSDSDDDLVFF
jgi:DNA-binding NarL/FixJ family response regulator